MGQALRRMWWVLVAIIGVGCANSGNHSADPFLTESCADNNNNCPRNCYKGYFNEHSYLFCRDKKKWTEARSVCEQATFALTRIESDEENNWVRMTANLRDMRETVWLGGSDRDYEGVWEWPDGNEFWHGRNNGERVAGLYENWHSGKPEGRNDRDDCLALLDKASWNDQNCDDKQAFVCEYYQRPE